ncbi:hypothetical protein PsorP6_004634 [Peronosclerospora sorghi]|uniref:Uncharacterized protein n=1 Tax=Peronosclerospora sorghi TaxID=230839 RepID=A0ACC0VL10_9STRA|nr:hypothetical protein PsorP6_004634 [Peronosclerospora sorghi]
MRRQQADRVTTSQDEQTRSPKEEWNNTLNANQANENSCVKWKFQNAAGRSREHSCRDDRVGTNTRRDPPVNWAARVRASITQLMEIEGISINSGNVAENISARREEQSFTERVDRLEAATVSIHKEILDRLRHLSSAKKMRLTLAEPRCSPMVTQSSHEHEALTALAVAAASGTQCAQKQTTPSMERAITKAKKPKRTKNIRHNSLPLNNRAGTERNPVQVRDPTLAQAVHTLTDKLLRLLDQIEATSDAATAETILAAAANIALEASEMKRCEEMALARMMEIEEHRLQILHGLAEYAKRKAERETDEEEKGISPDVLARNRSPDDTDTVDDN